ncbi:MAG TPA: hypothetical protein VJ997_08095, partial [Longimicrobiales bacterium]|nr:hypothetical protein [Longimicrobiales bacterium]
LARLCTRQGAVAVLALSVLLAVFVTGPAKLRAFATFARQSGMAVRAPVATRPTLVFVHEDWESRLGARLSATGMRLDSIRGALAHNSTCEVERFTRAREAATTTSVRPGPRLDFGEGGPRPLREVRMPSGSRIRTYADEQLSPECEREAASDFGGVVALAPLLWQGDLPGLDAHGAMFVRDLGPERNARLLAGFPDHEAAVLRRRGSDPPRLVPYDVGMEEGWGDRIGPP